MRALSVVEISMVEGTTRTVIKERQIKLDNFILKMQLVLDKKNRTGWCISCLLYAVVRGIFLYGWIGSAQKPERAGAQLEHRQGGQSRTQVGESVVQWV